MRKYLNADSRMKVALIWNIIGSLEDQERYIEKGTIDDREKEKLKYLRTALTYLRKYFSTWTIDLEEEEGKRIGKLIKTTGILFQDKYKARMQLKKWDNEVKHSIIEVHQDLIEDLLDQLISANGTCFGCGKTPKEVKGCRLREAMIRYDAPATTENPKVCQFEYESLESRKDEIDKKIKGEQTNEKRIKKPKTDPRNDRGRGEKGSNKTKKST